MGLRPMGSGASAPRRDELKLRLESGFVNSRSGDRQVLGVCAGVRLVVSDAREGLKHAVSTVLHRAAWRQPRPLHAQRARHHPAAHARPSNFRARLPPRETSTV